MNKARQKLLSGCMAIAFSMSTALVPALAMASPVFTTATTNDTLRLGGIDRYETAAKIVQQGWATSEFAVLSAGMDNNLVDALTAAPLAKAKNAPILLTEGTGLNSYAKEELTRLGVKTVYVTSGSGVIQKPVLDQLTSMDITVKPLGGADRFETALNIAKELPAANEFVVTTAWTNADALSVASIAAAKGMPILLTDAQSLNANVKTYIDSVKAAKTYVLGGTGVVSDTAKADLPNPVRIGGLDRFATNQEILKAFASDLKPGQVFVANGQNEHLADSLAGSPYAAQSKSPVVLTDGMLTEATKNFVKLNLLPNKVVALGGETVVGADVLTALTASTVYAEEGAVKGSSDATKLEEVQEVLKITGQNITVKNTKANYSIYLQGDNVTLDNVTVAGTVFIDPGQTGTTTLKGVKADKIVVMSGGQDSIHITNSVAGSLLVTSDSQTRVEATGTTTVGSTVVTSYAILDANGGSLGEVLITTEPGKDSVVELRGTFTEPVIVEGQVTLKAAANAVVPTVVIATQNAEQKVTLDGSFKAVEVKTEAKVDLAANAKVETMEATAKATVTVPPTAKIDTFDAGSTGTLVGGGGTVNNQTTTTTPSTPPPTTPPTGGSVGGGAGTTTPSTSITSFAIINGVTPVAQADVNGTSKTLSLTLIDNNQSITGLQIMTTPESSILKLNGLNSSNTGAVTFSNKTFPLTSGSYTISMYDLLGGAISGNDVSLGSLRSLFGSSVTFTGTLSADSYNQSTVNLTLTLGGTAGELNNEWATMSVDGTVISATIKGTKETTYLKDMGLYSFLINSIGELPSEVSTNQTTWNDPSTSDGRLAIQNAISTLTTKSWSLSTLADLNAKPIYFKKGNASTVYQLKITL